MSAESAVAALAGLVFDGVPVKCGGCGGWFHELTEKYLPEGVLRGSHLRLNSTYRGYGWYDFPHEDWVVGENVMCPQCMRPYRATEVARQVVIWFENLRIEHERKNTENEAEAGEAEAGEAEGAAAGAEDTAQGNSAPPESIGDLAVPGVVGVGSDDGGLPSSSDGTDGGLKDVSEIVRKMSWDGKTQAEIAETCGLSVYMVREIQNGRKV